MGTKGVVPWDLEIIKCALNGLVNYDYNYEIKYTNSSLCALYIQTQGWSAKQRTDPT